MKKMLVLFIAMVVLCYPNLAFAKVEIPSNAYNISKENTVAQTTIEDVVLEPNRLAKELLQSSNVAVQNPKLIELLNESQIGKNRGAFWYKASIYLGTWALNYTSEGGTPIWEHQKVNNNTIDNRGAKVPATLNYRQKEQKEITGQVAPTFSPDVEKMILKSATAASGLPLTLKAKIGAETKLESKYQVPVSKIATMNAYAPVLHEKGKVTFGEVYIVLKGGKRKVEVRNISSQSVNAWLPIQDYIFLKMQISNK